jgi:alpha-1,6-mannosyltransferase
MKLFGALGLLLIVLSLAGIALHVPGEGWVGSHERLNGLVGLMGVQVAAYLAAVVLVLRRPVPKRLVWLVLGVAVAMRVPLLIEPPFLSSDVNRYVWDGRVQAAGINPYLYVPADPALAGLRDHPVYVHINRADYARTIYPPAAELVFAAIGYVSQTVMATKLVMVGFEALAVACLLRLLAIARLPAERVLIYAWNPLAVWSFAGNGHVDAAAVGLLGLALWLRVRGRDGWAGFAFGAAVLMKFLPAVIAPALWRARAGWRLAGAALFTVLALYAVYIGAGWHVFGFLGGYGSEEGLSDGSGVWLLAGLAKIMSLPAWAPKMYFAGAAALLVLLGCRIAFRPHPPVGSAQDVVATCSGAALLMAVLTFAISPHYPWYFPWLALPCAVVPYPAVIWLSVVPVVLYIDPFDDRFYWPSLVFLPVLALGLVALRRRRVPISSVATEGTA